MHEVGKTLDDNEDLFDSGMYSKGMYSYNTNLE